MTQNNEKKDRLPIFRKRLNELLGDMTTTEFAEKVGLSRQTMGFYLNGDRIPDSATLIQICEACNVSADYLLGLSDVSSPDIQIQEIVKATGLSEKNVNFLINPAENFWDDPVSKYKESLYALVNLLIESCNDGEGKVTEPFQNIYTIQVAASAPLDEDDEIVNSLDIKARSRGYITLPANKGIKFLAAEIGKAIESNIFERYKAKERELPIGTLYNDGDIPEIHE